MKPIFMNLIFNRPPMKPKEENIYWCIIKCVDEKKETTEYHYSFVQFREKEFHLAEVENMKLEVAAWTELENPERHFKLPILTITT